MTDSVWQFWKKTRFEKILELFDIKIFWSFHKNVPRNSDQKIK